jgi:hypothetical protein
LKIIMPHSTVASKRAESHIAKRGEGVSLAILGGLSAIKEPYLLM